MSNPDIDADYIRALAEILDDNGLTEIKIEQEGLKLRVAREVKTVAAPAVAAPAAVAAAPAPAASAPAAEAPAESAGSSAPDGDAVTAPMVGTVYLQAEPGADPFVQVGDTVSEGQTLLIVEAMKTMNTIAAPRAGKVAAIMVDDSQPVEFGEPLIILS